MGQSHITSVCDTMVQSHITLVCGTMGQSHITSVCGTMVQSHITSVCGTMVQSHITSVCGTGSESHITSVCGTMVQSHITSVCGTMVQSHITSVCGTGSEYYISVWHTTRLVVWAGLCAMSSAVFLARTSEIFASCIHQARITYCHQLYQLYISADELYYHKYQPHKILFEEHIVSKILLLQTNVSNRYGS